MRPTSGHPHEYSRWKAKAEEAGFHAKIGPFGHNDGIGFQIEREIDYLRSFWIGCRERGVILFLPPPNPIYRVPDLGRVGNLCLALLTQMRDRPGPIMIDLKLLFEYSLVEISRVQWYAEEKEERSYRFAKIGWLPLSPEEADATFDRVAESFIPFNSGSDRVREPVGSLTWDISAAYAGGEAAVNLRDDLTFQLLRALRKCTRLGELLHAFEFQGPVRSFDPHAGVAGASRYDMEVPIVPDGDPTYFVAPDLRFGLLAPYPVLEICTFGPELIGSLGQDWPPLPVHLLRKNV